jgi:hypothetical protein
VIPRIMKDEALERVALGHRTRLCEEGLKEELLGHFQVSAFQKRGSKRDLTYRSPELLKHERCVV